MHQRVFAVPIHAGLELSSANKAWSESWSRALFPESQSDLWTFVEGRLQEVRGLFRSMLQKSGLDAPFQYFFPQFCWLVQPLAWQGHRILVCSMEWFPKTLRRLAPEGLSGLPEVLAHLLQCLSSLKLVWRHLMMCSHYLRPLQFARRWMMDFLCLLDGASSTNLTEWNSGALTLRTFSQNECHPSDNHPERVFLVGVIFVFREHFHCRWFVIMSEYVEYCLRWFLNCFFSLFCSFTCLRLWFRWDWTWISDDIVLKTIRLGFGLLQHTEWEDESSCDDLYTSCALHGDAPVFGMVVQSFQFGYEILTMLFSLLSPVRVTDCGPVRTRRGTWN